MQITIPTKFHAYHLENFRFDLQRFASVTITPNVALKNDSTIKVIFKGYYIDNNSAIFTYNAADKSFSETHSSPLSFRASIDNNNIVIKISVDSDFSDLYLIDTVTLDTANNKWIFDKGMYTSETSDYRFAFNDTTISYDSNKTFLSNFSALIYDYTITIKDKTYPVGFDNSGNLTSVDGTPLDNGKVTLDGKTYTFSGTTSSITYNEVAGNEWTVDNGVAKYGADSNVLVAISGLKNPTVKDGAISGLTVDETAKTVTVASELLGDSDVKITNSSDYTLLLGEGISSSQTTPAGWSGSTYKSASNTAGYSLSEDKKSVSYTAAVASTDLFTLSGVKSTTGIVVDSSAKTVTLTADNLNDTDVTITSDDYTLLLADGISSSQTTPAGWSGSTYKSASNTAGYSLSEDKKSVSYKAAVTSTDLFTLSGVKSTTGIVVDSSAKTVTLTADNLNDTDVTITSDDYTLQLGEGISSSQTTPAGWSGSTYKSASNTAGYSLSEDKKSVSYKAAVTSTDLFTLSGVKSTTGIVVDSSAKTVTLTADNLNDTDVTITSDDYTLLLADGISSSQTTPAGWSGTTYKSASNTAGYSLSEDKKSVSYTAAVASTDLFTLSGVKSTTGIVVDSSAKTVTLTADNLNDTDVTITSDDYTLLLADGISSSQTTPAGWSGSTYKSASTSAGYELSTDKKSVSYTAAVHSTNLFTLSGVKSTTGIVVDSSAKTVTLTADNLNDTDVTITSDDYTLLLGEGISSSQTTPAGWSGSTYKSASTSAGYELSTDKKSISYTAAVASTDLFTLSGVKSTTGIVVDSSAKTVTLTADNLNDTDVTITSDDYTLLLGEGISSSQTTPAGWSGSTYKSASNTAGYSLSEDKKSVSYKAAVPATDLFTLSGVKSTTGIVVDSSAKTVTLTADNLNDTDVTITSDDYTLQLADGISSSQTTPAGWSGTTYKSASTSAGYSLSEDKKSVSYTAAVHSTDLFTLSGVKSTTGIVVDSSAKTVTLTADNLNDTDVTITSDDYTLQLGEGISGSQTTPAGWSGTTYKSASNTAGYELSTDKKSISYTAAVPSTDLFTLSGVKSTTGIVVDSSAKTVTLTADNLNDTDVTITSDDYTLLLGEGISGSQTTPAGWSGTTYKSASTSAGYSLSEDKKSVSYTAAVHSTDLFTLSGVKSTTGIVVDSSAKTVTLTADNLNDTDVTITSDDYTLLLGEGISGSQTTPAGWSGSTYKSASNTAGYSLSEDKKSISYTAAVHSTDLFTLSGVKSTTGIVVDSSAKTVTLTADNLDGKDVTITSDDYTLQLADGISSSQTTPAGWSGSTYKSASNTAGYSLSEDKKSISYKAAVPATDLFTLSGVKSTTGIVVDSSAKTVTLTADNLNDTDVTITSDDYTLLLADGISSSQTTPAGWSGTTYKSASNTAGYELSTDKKSISYKAAVPATDLFTLSGVKSTTGIVVDSSAKTVTLTADNLNDTDVTITSDDYTLLLGEGISGSQTTPAGWSGSTYKSASNTAGYSLSEDKKSVSYTAAVASTDLFTLSGVKSTTGIVVDSSAKTVTLTADNLNDTDVTITSDDYTLLLGEGISGSQTTPAGWSGTTYKSASNTAGYSLSEDKKSISYTAAVHSTDLFTLSGVKSTTGIVVDSSAKTVTLTADNLNDTDVTITSDDYTLLLADGISSSQTTPAGWSGSTYKSASNTAGYSLSEDKKSVSYTAAVASTDLFTLSGVKSTTGIVVDSSAKTVTLTADNLNDTDVTITSDDYTLLLAEGISSSQTTPAGWSGTTYKSASTSAGYSLSEDKKSVSYTAAVHSTDLFTLSGVKSTTGIVVDSSAKTVTLTADNLNDTDVTITSDDYTLLLGEGISGSQTTPAGWSGTTYKSASTSAGYSLSEDKKSVSYTAAVHSTDLFTLSGVKSTTGIVVDSSAKTVTLTADNLNDTDVTITSDDYTLLLGEGISGSQTTPAGWSGTTYKSASNTAGYSLSEDKKSISYTAAVHSTDLFTLSGVKSTTGIVVDSSAKTVTLTADNLNDTDVTITSDDYTLLLGEGISSSQTTPAGWSGSTYKSASNTAGYSLSEDKKSVSYTSAMSAKSFTLTNLNEAAALGENLIVTDGDTTIFKFKAAALDKKTVTITGDDKFSVELDDDVDTTAETIAETKTFTNGTLNYLASGTGEYYTATATGVSYTAKNGGEILFTISGIKSIAGLSIDMQNKIVTISAASLNQETVTISNGYTLKLADDVKSPTKFYGRWVGGNGIYTYTGNGVTAGYKLIDNKIVYSEEIITGDQYTLHDANDTGIITESNDTEITEENSLNKHNVVLIEKDDSNSGNNIVFDANTTRVTVGSGRDSLLIYNDARAIVDMTNADDVTIVPYSGRVTLEGYDTSSGATILYPKTGNIVEAVKDNSVKLVGNRIQFNSDTSVQINNSGDSIIVNLVSEDGSVQKVGFTKTSGGELDTSKFEDDFLLKGNYAENSSDNQKHRGSIITAGKGNDTILAGSRDFVDGGNGRNQIFLTPYDLRQIRDGATIASSGNGRNTIHGFHEGFGYDGDVIQVKDFNNLKFKFDTDGLLLTANDSRIKFDGIGITSATTDDSTNSLGTNRAELIQITNGSSTMRTALAQTNQSILVQEDDYITPNAFFGNRSGLNFSEYNGNVEINLTDGTGKLGNWNATFRGINKLQAGDGMSTLIGDDTRNTLIAGTGYTSMWGGAGNDKLIGKGNSTDKDGRTTFFFFAGDGRDVISNFTFLNPENRFDGIDDKINITDTNEITEVFRSGDDVVLQINNSNDYLRIKDAVGKDFRINNLVAKVDENIHFDGIANCYVAVGGSSLIVDSSVSNAEIWLDDSHGTTFIGYTRTLDASAVEGNTSLVGNELNNTIIAGQGDASLWGGFSPDDDLLIGGNSRNTFFYCMGNGNDTIQGTNDKDFVILSDVSLDQIIETSISADSVSIRFTDGGSLQIQGTADITYQLADGSKYSASHERLEWDNR